MIVVEEHALITQKVLQRAREQNLKFNFKKLQLQINAVKYLGTIMSAEGVKPDPFKITAIFNILVPTDKSAVRHLLDMVKFIANHSQNISS